MTKKFNGYTFSYGPSIARMDIVLKCLEQPRTRRELAEMTSVGVRAIQSYLSTLMAETPRRIHVCDWRKNTPGSPSAVYRVGNKPDKARPPAETGAARARKRRKDAEYVIDNIYRQRAARIKPRRDAMTTALFGAA